MKFLGCSLLFLVYAIASMVWAARTEVGRERERAMVQGPVLILIGLGLTAIAVYALMSE